jgi:hypothetical protein
METIFLFALEIQVLLVVNPTIPMIEDPQRC